MKRWPSVVVLWLLAPALLWLSTYRPPADSRARATRLPVAIGGFTRVDEFGITPRQSELLGTADATWRAYADAGGRRVFVVGVFHEANWKSLHPPRICIEGSGMRIVEDGEITVETGGRRFPAGRILAEHEADRRPYLSLYVFVARDLVTARYGTFFLHHAPRALLRRATAGCLLRVEAWVDGDVAAAEARLAAFLAELLTGAERILADV
jgi:EpsI family protein